MSGQPVRVDSRPHLERKAKRLVRAGLLFIAGCALLGGALAAEVVLHYTAPSAPKGEPPA